MPATSSRRLLKALFVLSLLAAVALGGWFWVRYQGFADAPIALPGRAALVAAARPADGDTLYFVSRGDGSHVFSATLAEHNRAVACHQLKRCR